MDKYLDCKGLECPKPVIETKNALESLDEGKVIVTVDNAIAKENVTKFAKSMHYLFDVEESDNQFKITIFKGEIVADGITPAPKIPIQDLVILIAKDKLGEGNDELGSVLIKGYFYTLTESKPYPKAILFLNGGVVLTTESSPVLEHLRTLESNGVEILSCGTCLDYYMMKDKLAVGGVTNMYTIVEKMNGAKNTIRL